MPTLASKLKRSGRSYFSRFNFRNIPFVVGTSVTPSHNLGLNIQQVSRRNSTKSSGYKKKYLKTQVLSVMKTRQPNTNDVTPLLIRKVSRGIRPVSVLLDQMNGHCEGLVSNVNSQRTGFNSGENEMPKMSTDTEMISEKENNVSKQLRKEKGDSSDDKKQQSSSAVSKSNTPASSKNQQGISRISLKVNRILIVCVKIYYIMLILQDNIGNKIHIPDSHNSKEIRDVLINLHDQFEEMNT